MLIKLKENPIRSLLYYVATSLLIFSLFTGNPFNTIKGLWDIVLSPASLITDYISIGGISATFLNSSLVLFLMLIIFDKNKIQYNGTTIASAFLMAGFALFGKNILNILPIFIGVYIFAKVNGDPFKRYLYLALFGSSIAPVVSEVAVNLSGFGINLQSLTLAVLIGVALGFFIPAISVDCLRILQGFSLYTTGFATGLIGLLFTAFISSFGYTQSSNMIWTVGQNPVIYVFLYFLFASFIFFGYTLNGNSFNGYSKVFRHSGRAVADFTLMDGIPIAFINMGIVGAFSLSYLIVLNGDINGPTIGAIFTIVGYGALGKHLKNMIPPMLGVFTMSFISHWSLTDPSIQLAALFCTGLAPIAGQFGFGWGVVAGIMHSAIVLCVTSLHGGLNLYNNGFAAGLVVLIILPLIEALSKDS